jgi:hypothetical protein
MPSDWATIMRMHDQSILVMFAGVCAFAMNWYVFTGEQAQRIMTTVPLISTVVILMLEIVARLQK